ncbi:MAG: C1 family peptidase [Bacteroidota bacterium]
MYKINSLFPFAKGFSFLLFSLIINPILAQTFEPSFGAEFGDPKKIKLWKYTKTRGESLPISYSHSKYMTEIGNQKSFSNCVGWATAYYGGSYLFKDTAATEIEQYFSPFFVYNVLKNPFDKECKTGLFIRSALDFSKNIGMVPLQNYPAICLQTERPALGLNKISLQNQSTYLRLRKIAAQYRIGDYHDLGTTNFEEKAKQALNQNKAIVVGIRFQKSMIKSFAPWNGILDGELGGHAMNVVGYNDTLYGGSFQLINSWGDDWGDNGNMFVRYEDLYKCLEVAYVMERGTSDTLDGVNMKNTTFKLSVRSSSGEVVMSKFENKKIPYPVSEFYVPVLFDNTEISAEMIAKDRKKQRTRTMNYTIQASANRTLYAYVFRELVNNEIELMYPTKNEDDNKISKNINGTRTNRIPHDTKKFLNHSLAIESQGYDRVNSSKILVLMSSEKLDINEITPYLKEKYANLRVFTHEVFGKKINYLDGYLQPSNDGKSISYEINELTNAIFPVIIDLDFK